MPAIRTLLGTLVACVCITVVPVVNADSEQGNSADKGENLLAGLIIQVSDIERSIDFYTELLGLKTVGRVDNEGELVEILLSTTGTFLNGMMLTLQPAKEGREDSGADPADLGTLIFMVPSNEKVATRVRAAGFEVIERDAQHLMVRDPDGYQLMFYQLDPAILGTKPSGT